jgi:hypothetical protein
MATGGSRSNISTEPGQSNAIPEVHRRLATLAKLHGRSLSELVDRSPTRAARKLGAARPAVPAGEPPAPEAGRRRKVDGPVTGGASRAKA